MPCLKKKIMLLVTDRFHLQIKQCLTQKEISFTFVIPMIGEKLLSALGVCRRRKFQTRETVCPLGCRPELKEPWPKKGINSTSNSMLTKKTVFGDFQPEVFQRRMGRRATKMASYCLPSKLSGTCLFAREHAWFHPLSERCASHVCGSGPRSACDSDFKPRAFWNARLFRAMVALWRLMTSSLQAIEAPSVFVVT